jgi:type IV secretory pathway VirB2 component (pilin)
LVIMIGGYEWMVGDDSAKKTKASTTILSAVGGYVVIVLAPMVANVISRTFGSSQDKGFDPTAINELLTKIIDLLLTLSSLVAVVAIVFAGYGFFVEYFYNESRQQGKINPRELLMSGVTGLIVVTFARPIVGFINSTFSASPTTLTINNGFIIAFIQNILAKFLIPLSSLLAVFFLVIAGYYWITANGDEKKIGSAQKMATNALIGIIVVLLSTTIVQMIIFFIRPTTGFIPGNTGDQNTLFTNTQTGIKPPYDTSGNSTQSQR